MALTKVTNELLEIGVLADATNFTDRILISQNKVATRTKIVTKSSNILKY